MSKQTFRKQMGLVQHRPKKFEADESAFGYHVCPACWNAYKYQPVLAAFNDPRFTIVKGQTYICPECQEDEAITDGELQS